MKNRSVIISGGLAVAAILGAAQQGMAQLAIPAPVAKADDAAEAEGIIFERQQIMSQLGKDSETLGMIAAGAAPASKLKEVTRAIAQGARSSVTAFQKPIPGGRSKPEIWSNNSEFMKLMNAFATNSEAMAKVGEKGNVDAVTAMMVDAMPCKSCHDSYRAPKKP